MESSQLKLKLFIWLIWAEEEHCEAFIWLFNILFIQIKSFVNFQIHINLGAGESEVSSPLNMKLNDLKWHTVKLVRNEAEMELILDSQHTSR